LREEDSVAANLKVERIDDPALWDGFVTASPQGTVFSTSRWIAAAARAQGGEPVVCGIMKNGEIVAGITFLRIKRGLFTKATSPILTPYGGMLYRPTPGKRISEAESFNMDCARLMIDTLKKGYSNAFFVHSPGFTDVRPFTWNGWSGSIRYTYVLDITNTDRLWDILERRVRTVIRNAESSLDIGGPIGTGEFTDLYERIYGDRETSVPVDTAAVKAMTDEILGSGLGNMVTVRDASGEVISAMILVSDEHCVYAWLSGSIPGENSSGAFSLLFWNAVKRYSGSHDRLDMVGGNIPSISFFKKGFGGLLVPYYVTEYYSSPVTKAAFSIYTRLRSIL